MGEGDKAGIFKEVEYGNPVFPSRFHTDLMTGKPGKPGCQVPKALGEGGETGFMVFSPSSGISDPDTGVDPGFMNVQTAAVLPQDFKQRHPSRLVIGKAALTGRPAKSS